MISWIRNLLKPATRPLNRIELRREQYLKNLLEIQAYKDGDLIIPVLKSNAYGHGLFEICDMLNHADYISMVAVDSFPEYRVVKKRTNKKILILGETWPENYAMFDTKRAIFAVYTLQTLHALGKLGKNLRIHLFLNTGMNREGIQKEKLGEFLEVLKQYSRIELEGVMSHLSNGDDEDLSHTTQQIHHFKEMVEIIHAQGFTPIYKHLGASAGLVRIQDDFFNAWRVGKLSYGYNPFAKGHQSYNRIPEVKPFLDVYSTVVSVQHVKSGEGASYTKSWKATQDTWVASIPFGYYEGFDRRMSNALVFHIYGKEYKQVGNICMNLTCVEVDHDIKVGDTVHCISSDSGSGMSIAHLASITKTIAYEVLVKLSEKVKRIVM